MSNVNLSIEMKNVESVSISWILEDLEKRGEIESVRVSMAPAPAVSPANEELRYDEGTLEKVSDVLTKYGLQNKDANNLIDQMQNAGILFRERA